MYRYQLDNKRERILFRGDKEACLAFFAKRSPFRPLGRVPHVEVRGDPGHPVRSRIVRLSGVTRPARLPSSIPAARADKLLAAIAKRADPSPISLLTHGHLDHVGAAAELRERTGVAITGPHKGGCLLARYPAPADPDVRLCPYSGLYTG